MSMSTNMSIGGQFYDYQYKTGHLYVDISVSSVSLSCQYLMSMSSNMAGKRPLDARYMLVCIRVVSISDGNYEL